MELLIDVNTISNAWRFLSQHGGLIYIAIIFAVYHILNVIKNEKLITRMEDDAIAKEKRKVENRIRDLLSSIKSMVYESMEDYVYGNGANPSRRITVIKRKKQTSLVASRFLSDHYDASKEVLLHVVAPEVIEWIDDHEISTAHPCRETLELSATELRNRILSEIRSRTGSNSDTRHVEEKVVTFELCYEFSVSAYKYTQQMRTMRDNFVKEETKSIRIPLTIRMSSFRKRK